MSKIATVFELMKQHPRASDAEIADMMENTSEKTVETYRLRLRKRGFIKVNLDRSVTILKEFSNKEPSLKQQCYEEMLEIYMEDFRAQTTFSDRLAVGREIRLVLDKL